jgi:hypothetical protein
MLDWLIRRRLAAFERKYGYDAGYARALLAADRQALLAFGKVQGISTYRRDVPAAAWYAAKLIAAASEDCGPCTQLMVTMAEQDGVDPAVLRAVAGGDLAAMPPDVALAYRFARAVLDHDPAADRLREEVVRRFGPRGLVSLAFAVTSARIYPTVKYALGYATSCSRVTIGGIPAPVARSAA